MEAQVTAQIVSDLFWLGIVCGSLIGFGLAKVATWALDYIERRIDERDTFRDMVEQAREYAARLEEARQTEQRG